MYLSVIFSCVVFLIVPFTFPFTFDASATLIVTCGASIFTSYYDLVYKYIIISENTKTVINKST